MDTRLSGLDLFSGIGGISAALKPWTRPVAYCERDTYCQAQLLSRMQTGDLDRAPIWDDITTLRTDMLPPVEIVYGGFPCQNISAAGAGAGLAGESSRLYFELERIVAAARPAFVFLENVPAIRTRGLGRVVWGLASLGYDLRWTAVSASSVGAPHKRDRWFCLAANTDSIKQWNESGRRRWSNRQGAAVVRNDGAKESLADSESFGSDTWARRARGESEAEPIHTFSDDWWATEPDVGGTFDGLSGGVDRSGGVVYDEEIETRAGQILRELRNDISSEALFWATRGLECLQAEEVLLAFVREYEAGGRLPREFVAREATPERLLRAMQENRDLARASLRRESAEQFFGEYPNALRELSQLVASRGQTPWDHTLWESAVRRIERGVPHRVDRIKCLGNSVVPQQARRAFEILAGLT